MSYSRAKPAEVVDYDSDESRIVSGTEVSAKTSRRRVQDQSSSKASKQVERSGRTAAPRVPESDSGYSSTPARVTSTKATTAYAKSTHTTGTAHPIKPKPVIYRADSARSTKRAATVSTPTTNRPECTDPHCRDPNCESSRNQERRYTNPNRVSMPPPPPPHQYPSDYAAMPPPATIPRPGTESNTRSRPQSFHAPAGMPMTYSTAQPGPPPAASAYYGYPQAYAQQQQQQQQQPMYGSTPPTQSSMYPPPSSAAVAQPPSSPLTTTYPGFPGQTTKISARTGNPAVPGLANSISMAIPNYSAPPGGLARGRRSNAEVHSDRRRTHADDYTSSESEDSEDERYYDHQYDQDRRREAKRISYEPSRSKSRHRQCREVVVEDSRRPAARKSYTTSTVPTRRASRRDSPSRPDMAHRTNSDPIDSYLSSSEKHNLERAVVERRDTGRRNATVLKHTRRPSVASSYDTPPTSLSSGTGHVQAVIEDRHGRRRVYLSKDVFDALSRQRELEDQREDQRGRLEDHQRLQQERIERYQKDMSGGIEREDLTATNIQQASRKTMSHVSSRSHKSTASGSKVSRIGGLMIESGGTVLQIEEGIQEISLKADDSGGTRIVIGSVNGCESSYHGSKAGGSRVGRSRASPPEREPIHEEGGYEKAY